MENIAVPTIEETKSLLDEKLKIVCAELAQALSNDPEKTKKPTRILAQKELEIRELIDMIKINSLELLNEYVLERTNVIIIAGFQDGDEGKWKVVTWSDTKVAWSSTNDQNEVPWAAKRRISFVAWPAWWGNAGHNVILKDGTRVALHELPGGAIIETAQVYLGQSRLVNIKNVIKEMKEIEDHGIESMIEKDWKQVPKMIIAGQANVNLKSLSGKLDLLFEAVKEIPVWTTQTGMWPTAALECLRAWVKFNEMVNNPKECIRKIKETVNAFNKNPADIFKDEKTGEFIKEKIERFKNIALKKQDEKDEFDLLEDNVKSQWINKRIWLNLEEIIHEFEESEEQLSKEIEKWTIMIDEWNMMLSEADDRKELIIVECSQSVSLWKNGWKSPNCSSTDTSPNGAYSSLGLTRKDHHVIYWCAKAKKTKVWWWQFFTKQEWTVVDKYREDAGEVWATTGRPRDIGHIDTVEIKKAIMTNGCDVLCINMLDKISQFGNDNKVCIWYRNTDTKRVHTHTFPTRSEEKYIEPIYSRDFDLSDDISRCKSFEELPNEYKAYIACIIRTVGFKGIVSLGMWPARGDVIVTSNFIDYDD